MPNQPFRKIELLRFIAPSVLAAFCLLIFAGAMHEQFDLGIVMSIIVTTPLLAGYLSLAYLILRLDRAPIYLVVDGLSLCTSTLFALMIPAMFIDDWGDPPPPMNAWTIGVTIVIIAVALTGIPTAILTVRDLRRTRQGIRAYFQRRALTAPAPETDPAEFQVQPGWDTSAPPPPSTTAAPQPPNHAHDQVN